MVSQLVLHGEGEELDVDRADFEVVKTHKGL